MRIVILVLIMVIVAPAYAGLDCGGTEPFWNLAIGTSTAVFDGQDMGKVTFDSMTTQDARGIQPGIVRKYLFKNTKTTADAVVLKQKCNDGMSDTLYPYNITLTITKTVFSGCCR